MQLLNIIIILFCSHLNIPLAALGSEKCSKCADLKLSDPRAFRVHEKLYTDRQALYNAEVQTEQTAVYTLDMQLVMLLPR